MIDQQRLEHPPAKPAPGCEPVWNVAEFLEIQSIVGRDRAEALLRSYALHLEFVAVSIRDTSLDASLLNEVVHNLKSMSGQFGFEALRAFCDRVNASCDAAEFDDIVVPLLALIEASRAAAQSHGGRMKIVETGQVA